MKLPARLSVASRPQRLEDLGALFDRVGTRMFRVAAAMLRSTANAEDAVQDVFVELARSPAWLSRAGDVDAYVFATLRYGVLRRMRKIKTEDRKLRLILPGTPSPAPEFLDEELELALQNLPADQREVIALKIDGGRTFAQIAGVLNIKPGTAASRYRYALEKLHSALGGVR